VRNLLRIVSCNFLVPFVAAQNPVDQANPPNATQVLYKRSNCRAGALVPGFAAGPAAGSGLADISDRPQGFAGSTTLIASQPVLKAIDIRSGEIRWSHPYSAGSDGGMSGLLTTAGKLLFGGDSTNHFIAFDPTNGRILWHAGLIAPVSNGPMTYQLDGKQYIVVAGGDTLYCFGLNE
jgi:outer membrane protein assembly factor BamB